VLQCSDGWVGSKADIALARRVMSALPRTEDIARRNRHVRFVPEADMRVHEITV
jgi:hypothetical protein